MQPAARLFQEAAAMQSAGRLAEAEAKYRQVLVLDPNHADATHLLGIALHQLGRSNEAVDLINRATQLAPNIAAFFCNLGSVLAAIGRTPEAVIALERATRLNPNFPEAFNNLGTALKQSGQPDRAIGAYRQALALRPQYADAHFNLAATMLDRGHNAEAIAGFNRAIAITPQYAEAFNNLGTALQASGQFAESIAAYRRAIALAPENAHAHGNLGNTLGLIGRLNEAIAELRKATRLRPDIPEFHANLANVLRDDDQLDQAMAETQAALTLKPDMAHALATQAGIFKDRGQLDDAIAAYRRAVEISGDSKIADSLLLTLHYYPDYDARMLFVEHQNWESRFAEPFYALWPVHANDRAPERTIRIGYVGDMSNSPVGRFMLPLLTQHDRSMYQAYCYADVLRPDAMTDKLRAQAKHWRDVAGLSDDQLAARILEDRIDILVDLAMHGGRNRLLVFARKPVPIQITYLAYVSTTGLRAIDYRLTDPQLDPTDEDQPYYSEKTVRLPRTYWCYQPPDQAPDITPPPALSSGQITFGSMNRSAKITRIAFATWCRILQSVPNSRLVLHWGEGSHRDFARRILSDKGIDPARLDFVAAIPFDQYLRQYNRFDIALDPFPYPGGTTTCDALWMGVPVITLAGRTASSRGGLTIMANLNLTDLVANSPDHYVHLATQLAANTDRLQSLRSTMRQRMLASPLMDAPQFARDFESALRQMWRNWCADQSNGQSSAVG